MLARGWTVVEPPQLRIVPDEIWQAVVKRLASVSATFSSKQTADLCSRSYTARYLFSGFLKCGLHGSNVVLISGRGGVGRAKYGCPFHQNRGICANTLVIRRDRLERELILDSSGKSFAKISLPLPSRSSSASCARVWTTPDPT
jgi:site-specific DNA recombinase